MQVSMCRRRWAPANWRYGRGKTARSAEAASTWTSGWHHSNKCSSLGWQLATHRPESWVTWNGLLDLPGVDDLIEYETRVNYVIPKYEDAVICTYDLTRFGASVVMDALRTHPVVIIGGLLQENPFFVPPDQLLFEIRERRSVHKSANTVR
jgi:MEDS: MEthanogen/methylotroph, DcmR Sensory domain